jgi:hypothetical protein
MTIIIIIFALIFVCAIFQPDDYDNKRKKEEQEIIARASKLHEEGMKNNWRNK